MKLYRTCCYRKISRFGVETGDFALRRAASHHHVDYFSITAGHVLFTYNLVAP